MLKITGSGQIQGPKGNVKLTSIQEAEFILFSFVSKVADADESYSYREAYHKYQ